MSADKLARELARAGMVQPLASRGIVGQVSPEAIVDDAQTATGGSGATLPELGGSNRGVPIRHAAALLDRLRADGALVPTVPASAGADSAQKGQALR